MCHFFFFDASTDPQMTNYEREKMENCMRNSRVFCSLGIREATEILKKSRPKANVATREDSGSLYELEDNDDIEQGVFDKVAKIQPNIYVEYAVHEKN